MKTAIPSLLLFATFYFQLSTASAQGSLTPPGAPAPTMKSLDQMEPRVPIASAPFTINSPGSYYLTSNLTVSSVNAITISANNVTLDLGGFTIASTTPVASVDEGILINGSLTNITIRNGHISGGVTNNAGVYSGSGFGFGIASSGFPSNVRVSRVSVSGCQYDGIYLQYSSTLVESCVVNTVGAYGIQAQTVSDSTANDCGITAVSATTANNCIGSISGSGSGVLATTAINCYGSSTGSGTGVNALSATGCRGSSTNGIGVAAITADNCNADSFGAAGALTATTAINCRANAAGSGNGIYAVTTENSYGESQSGVGINSGVAENCFANTVTGASGLAAFENAHNCFGNCNNGGTGLIVSIGAAEDCYGSSGTGTGLSAGNAKNCQGHSSAGVGLSASIASECYGASNTGTGLSAATAASCYGSGGGNSPGLIVSTSAHNCSAVSPSGTGISLGQGGSLSGCVAESSAIGISAGDASTIQNCTVGLCSGDGIRVTNNCQVIGNLCTKNGSGSTTTASIHVLGNNNRIDGNHCIGKLTSGGNGIKVEAGRNLIIRNSSKDHNTQDYDIIASDGSGVNSYGQIIAVPGNNFVNSNPWANFAF